MEYLSSHSDNVGMTANKFAANINELFSVLRLFKKRMGCQEEEDFAVGLR